MLKKLAAVSIVMGALAAPSIANAGCGGSCGHHKKHAKHKGARFLKALAKAGVAQDVVGQIQAKMKEYKGTKRAAKKAIRGKKRALHQLFAAATLDSAKIDSLAGEIATMKADKFKAKVRFMTGIAGMLTAEQRANFFKNMARKHRHRRGHRARKGRRKK